MRHTRDTEPLLPPWVFGLALKIGPLAVLVAIYYVLSLVGLSSAVLVPSIIVLALAVAIYFGGRFYKRFYAGRDGRCTARSPQQRAACRHFMPGARLGGGCGRLREDGRCRHAR
jgi:hypothetical protein